MDSGHPKHVAAWLAETFGGPATYTLEHGGYHHMVHQHAGLSLTEEQRRPWIDRMLTTADLVGLPNDPDFRAAFVAYLEWGTRIALFNSAPGHVAHRAWPSPQMGLGGGPAVRPFPLGRPRRRGEGPRAVCRGAGSVRGPPSSPSLSWLVRSLHEALVGDGFDE